MTLYDIKVVFVEDCHCGSFRPDFTGWGSIPVMSPASIQSVLRRSALCAVVTACAIAAPLASDWPEWRGPARDGVSMEINLPSKWSPRGENLAWRIPIGSRSSPVAFGNRLYLNAPVGTLENTQERLVALDAETG